MEIVIVGAGAIGRFFGGMLGREGHEVVFVEKDPEVVKAVNNKGIEFMELGDAKSSAYPTVQAQAIPEGGSIDSCDLIIMAIKGILPQLLPEA
ncbi:MAG: NAD-binding protein [Desulfobacteraceae bacterium]|nr:MAG: NAD-binding protein [Desulfobacteraceae bacterium]